jgi:hypothetical protein
MPTAGKINGTRGQYMIDFLQELNWVIVGQII